MQLSAILESLLIASQDPLSSVEMARLVRARVAEAEDVLIRETDEGNTPGPLPDWLVALAKTTPENVSETIATLIAYYAETERAFTILERPKGWKLYTRTDFGEFVRHLFPGRKPERLSGPAMETLAIVAYRQPITRADLEAVRGVAVDGVMQTLLDRGLVRIAGRAEVPGRPLLYETTQHFMEHFGLKDLDDLPNAGELRRIPLPTATPLPEEKPPELPLGDLSHPSDPSDPPGETSAAEAEIEEPK